MKFNPNFKYVELHNHLDGSIKAETIYKICQKYSIDMPYSNVESLKKFLEIKEPSSLRIFLSKFDSVLSIVKGNQEAIAEICYDFVKMAAESKVCYIEARFSPHTLSSDSLSTDVVLKTVLDSFRRADKEFGVVTRTILCVLRHEDLKEPNIIDLAIKYKKHGVVGIDLAGDEQHSVERNGTHSDIVELFQRAKRENIHRTVHAGENGKVDMIKEAIDVLHAERIGHGYHILDDEKYYHELKEKNVHFEVCPSSSFLTMAVDIDPKKHPFHTFSKDKINYSINCDDIMITGRNLKEEYQFCKEKFGITNDEIKRVNFNAARSSFLEEDEKSALLDHLKTVF